MTIIATSSSRLPCLAIHTYTDTDHTDENEVACLTRLAVSVKRTVCRHHHACRCLDMLLSCTLDAIVWVRYFNVASPQQQPNGNYKRQVRLSAAFTLMKSRERHVMQAKSPIVTNRNKVQPDSMYVIYAPGKVMPILEVGGCTPPTPWSRHMNQK